jgi:membrane-associated phospholipid phosphatase
MKGWRDWRLVLASTVAAIVFCYVAVDQPLAWFAHAHLKPYAVFVHMQRLPEAFVPLATGLVILLGAAILAGRTLKHWQMTALTGGASVLVTAVVNSQLKTAFGRTWPETWTANNPSLIRDGVYGFQPFHGGTAFASFPSGHTAVACAAMTVLWICYPRLRPLYAVVVAVTVTGLIGANFHFLGDIIAGGFLGASVALAAVRIAGLTATAGPPPSLTPPARS